MKRLRKIFNIITSLFIVLSLSGCAGVEAQLTSCLEQLSETLNNMGATPPSKDDGNDVPQSIELVFPEGKFSSTNDTMTYRDCYVLVDGQWANSSYDIEWKFNGEASSHEGGLYTFAPSSTEKSVVVEAVITYTELTDEKDENGEYIEDIKTLKAKEKFVYFAPFSTPIATCSTTDFAKTYTISGFTDNDLIEWYVNGEKTFEGDVYAFAPTKAGRYTVSATVNGVEAIVENPNTIKQGPQTVTDVKVDIDTYYPQVYISFDGDPQAQYIIRKSYGEKYTEYSTTTNSFFISYEEFFTEDSVYQYNVQVKTANDDVYVNSVYSNAVSVRKPTSDVRKYLQDSQGVENLYISSKEDFYKQFDYMMLTREQPDSEETSISRKFYIGYDMAGDIDDLINDAFDACGYTGSYRLGSSGNNPYTVTITFKTGNEPNIPSTSNVPSASQYANNMNAYPLAISEEGMQSSLPIDSKEKKEVTNTDQLYRLAELGYCPMPTSGSVAKTVMDNARTVLSVIIDENMSDYEIALAVYDWVMYKNAYNNEVLSLNTNQAVEHPAFYLEGIMYADNYGYAVCDGISKTYSLLCNMAGVECLRVVGEAGQNGAWGGHAWNKVKVDGNWYIVDATWGDVSMGVSYKTGVIITTTHTDYYEMGMHNYFLVTDEFVKDNHKEDSSHYPKTAPLPYNHFARQTMTSGGVTVDMYVNETGAELKAKLDVIADAIIADVRSKNRIQSVQVGEKLKQSYYFFYEIGYSPLAKNNVISYMSASSSFAKKLKTQNYGFSLFEIDGTIGIIVSYHYASRLPSASLKIA